jgi:hypothetical protein
VSSEPIQGGDYSLEGNFQAAAAWKRVRKRWNAYDWKNNKKRETMQGQTLLLGSL